MSRLSPFNSPLLLGFEPFEQMLDRLTKSAGDGYPPYNIEQPGPNALRIVLAVAGFAREDLSIVVDGNQLVIRGRHKDEAGRTYLHRGIAARPFQRAFVLADGIEVSGAALDNGLLTVDLARPPAETRVRAVEIRSGGGSGRDGAERNTIDVAAKRSG
jgi:HSP20 family molecular chaperone IbpA